MNQSLSSRDEQVIWHPYTQHLRREPPLAIVRGTGARLFDDKGRSYIDAISSWWVNLHGHAHPHIAEALGRQALILEQVIFTSFTHEPAILLAERLLGILPPGFAKVFYSDNGSTAVEVAIKMAIQFWKNRTTGLTNGSPTGTPGGRNKILALSHAYHGDTFGAMSVSDRGIFTLAFREYLFDVVTVDCPHPENMEKIRNTIRQHGREMACFIYEPLLQAAGGMRLYPAEGLDEMLRMLRSEGVLLIADEVMTGFGRTGKWFASEYLQERPDIICLSKGLTGGTLALGVTAATQQVFDAFLSEDRQLSFFHGHSFTANPLACVAALASMDLLLQPGCRESIDRIGRRQAGFAAQISDRRSVRGARALGTLLAFELNDGADGYLHSAGQAITAAALRQGIYLRPLGNTVYCLPPYCITEEELSAVYRFLEEMLDKQESKEAMASPV